MVSIPAEPTNTLLVKDRKLLKIDFLKTSGIPFVPPEPIIWFKGSTSKFNLVDIFVLQNVNGEMVQKFLKPSEIDVYLKEIEKEEADEKASKDKNKEY